jgi:hypothetical protein
MLELSIALAICVWMTALIDLIKSCHAPRCTVMETTVPLLMKGQSIAQTLKDTLQNIVKF